MKNLRIVVTGFVCVLILGSTVFLLKQNKIEEVAANNVHVADGKQIILLTAKGGYFPRQTTAKAGLPTVIKMQTNGTYDCSAALNIPAAGYRGFLPPSGETEIDLPEQTAGMVVRGVCGMGMYSFSISFN